MAAIASRQHGALAARRLAEGKLCLRRESGCPTEEATNRHRPRRGEVASEQSPGVESSSQKATKVGRHHAKQVKVCEVLFNTLGQSGSKGDGKPALAAKLESPDQRRD